MSADPSPVTPLILRAAQTYIKHGLFPLPIAPGDKSPMVKNWPNLTLGDLDLDIFRRPGVNIGLRMGVQPDGRNIQAFDIDVKHVDGFATWAKLTAGIAMPETAFHDTPSGGRHYFFELPSDLVALTKGGPDGLDLRGKGGQVVAQPSQFENGAYTFDHAIHLVKVAPIPLALIDRVFSPAVVPPAQPHQPTLPGRWSSAEWVRDHLDWTTYLLKHGWVHVRGELWRHPTATNEHSAALKNNGAGPLNGWSYNLPPALLALDRSSTAGTVTFTLFDFIAAYEFEGDTSRCARWVWQQYGPRDEGLGLRATAPDPIVAGRAGDALSTVPESRLPADVWLSRPKLAQIHQAAKATMASPEALLVHALIRSSALIPPCFKLPGLRVAEVGVASLDLMGCIVGETGEGKSYVDSVARDLVPDPNPMADDESKAVLLDLPVGSGEGLIDSFFENVRVDDDSKRGFHDEWRVAHQGVHLVIDEGNAFASMTKRTGVTIVETMNQAWSGTQLGNTNTKKGERRRLIRGGTVRFACLINIQASNAYKLFDEDMTSVGFAGRLLYGHAVDPEATRSGPEWPGPLALPNWPAHHPSLNRIILTYDDEIRDEVQSRHEQAARGKGDPDRRRSQHLVMQCKVAGILAMWENRTHVSVDDWSISASILAMSSRVLEYLDRLRQAALSDQRRMADDRAAERQYRVTTGAEARLRADYKAKAIEAVRRRQPLLRTDYLKPMKSKYRTIMRSVLDELVEEGAIVERDDGLSIK